MKRILSYGILIIMLLSLASVLVLSQDSIVELDAPVPFDYYRDRLQYSGQSVSVVVDAPVPFDYYRDRLQYSGQSVSVVVDAPVPFDYYQDRLQYSGQGAPVESSKVAALASNLELHGFHELMW